MSGTDTSRSDKKIAILSRLPERKKWGGRTLLGLIREYTEELKETITGKKTITEENECMREFYEYAEVAQDNISRYSKNEKLTFYALGIIFLNIIILLVSYFTSFIKLDAVIFTNSFLYMLPAAVIPFVSWVLSTNENFWAFHQRKRLYFYLCVMNFVLVILQPVYTLVRNMVVPAVVKIPTNPVLSFKMVLLLGYIFTFVLFAVICWFLYMQVEPLVTNQMLKRNIELFKLQHVYDRRVDKDARYDSHHIKNLETGKEITIKEADRFLQTEINGASGTGKTSTIFINTICEDLDKKVQNRERRQEKMMKLILDGKATIVGPLREFDESAVRAIGKSPKEREKNAEELKRIKQRYPDCGITVIAPNASLITDIIRLCDARDIKVNVVDPVSDYSHFSNVKEVSINPFYIKTGLSEDERVIHITGASMAFAEVLIATNQQNGDGDRYFTDISLSVSSNTAAIVMLAKNICGEQAYFNDIQRCINNFSLIKEYVDIIENHYNIKIEGTQAASRNSQANIQDAAEAMRQKQLEKEKRKNSASAQENPYYQQILFVKNELLGAGAADMFSQSRGLRNLLNKIVVDPRIKTKLSGEKGKDLLDYDTALSENQITVINTAIELGKETCTSFGLFNILSHRQSVLRRPMETRTPHFLWIDECTQYMHPVYEDIISLYRQYKVAAYLALQALTQTEKSKATTYLKNVFLGAGTHIVFGRLAPEDMKLYSEMAGILRENIEQKTSSENSVLASSPSYSESVRLTPTITNVLEGADMRTLDFLELTVFTVDSGRVLPGQLARVFFIGQKAYEKKQMKTFLWQKAVPEAFSKKCEERIREEFVYNENQDVIPKEETITIVTVEQDKLALADSTNKELSLEEQDEILNDLIRNGLMFDDEADEGTQEEDDESGDIKKVAAEDGTEDEFDYSTAVNEFAKY